MKIGRTVACILALVCSHSFAAQQPTLLDQSGNPLILNGQKINYSQEQTSSSHIATSVDNVPKLLHNDTLNQQAITNTSMYKSLEIFNLGIGIGYDGMITGDFNGDAKVELVLANPSNIIFAEYEQNSLSLTGKLPLSAGYAKLQYFKDKNSDSHYAFLIQSGELIRIDLLTRKVAGSLFLSQAMTFKILQVSESTSVLLARSYDGTLFFVNPSTMELLTKLTGFNSDVIQVGSFTKLGTPQVLFADGAIYNFKDNTLSLDKQLTKQPQSQVQAMDTNNDGLDELIWSEGWYRIQVYSPKTDELLFTYSTSHDITALTLFDVDQDGKKEVVYGDGQWGALHAFKPDNGQKLWSIDNPDHSVTQIAIADFDNDGKLDITWGAGYTSSGPDFLYIADIASKTIKWQSEDIVGPFNSNQLADVDLDGDLDALVLIPRSNSGYNGAVLQAFDIQSKKRIYSFNAAFNFGSRAVIALGDVDGDGIEDGIIGSSSMYTQSVGIFDLRYGIKKLEVELSDGDETSSLALVDLDNNGRMEIIAGSSTLHSGSNGSNLKVLDGKTGNLLKTSPILNSYGSGITHIAVIPTPDNSGIYALMAGDLFKYNYTTNSSKQLSTSGNFSSLATILVNGEPTLFASSRNKLLSLNSDGIATNTYLPCNQDDISAIAPAQIGSLVVNCGTQSVLFDLANSNIEQIHTPDNWNAAPAVYSQFNNKNYLIFGGNTVAVYQNGTKLKLPSPDSQTLKTHVLKPLTGQFSIPAEVDFFAVNNTMKLGSLTFTDRAKGQFSYTPLGNIGTETIKIYAVKEGVLSPVSESTIEITNTTPVAQNMTVSTHWNKPVQLTLAATDEDLEQLTFILNSQPNHGEVKLLDSAKGLVEYKPSGTSNSNASFSFSAKDTLITSELKNVLITLTNTTPQATDLSYNTSWETPVNGGLKGEDADGDTLRFELVAQPARGTVELNPETGLFVFKTPNDFDDSVTFSYVVKDKFASSTAKTVTITIKGASESGGSIGTLGLFVLVLLTITRRLS